MADDKLKYSDVIEPDDSIERLVNQLEEFNKAYNTMVNSIKSGAEKVSHSVKSASGATSEGRKAIDEATIATTKLERAQAELKIALSETGEQIAWLKAQTVDVNKATVEQQRYIKQTISSYDRLKSDLKQTVDLYKSLSAAERAESEMGQQLLNDIINLKNQIKALDDQMKPHIQTISEVQKAEQKLAFLRSEEGQRLLALKREINEVIAASKGEKEVKDELTRAYERLNRVRSEEYAKQQEAMMLADEEARKTKLQIQLNNSAVGSYNYLAAQYELNKIKLNGMSQEERNAIDVGKKLEAETKRIYQQMIVLQEATGNHQLSIGNYAKAWNGLGNAMNQIVREFPAMTMGADMFFLAISNNVPILVDEIERVRRQNKLLAASGRETQSIVKTITRSIFGWQTALIILLTVLSKFGGEIIDFVKNIGKAKKAGVDMEKVLENINEELKSTNANYGDNIVTLKKLKNEFVGLVMGEAGLAAQNKWIKDNASEFKKLGISINSVTDAERVFLKMSTAVIEAFKLRAKAAAAQSLAEKKYAEAFTKEEERLKGAPQDYGRQQAQDIKSLITRYIGTGKKVKEIPGLEAFIGTDLGEKLASEVQFESKAQREAIGAIEYAQAPITKDWADILEISRRLAVRQEYEVAVLEDEAEAYFDIANAAKLAASAKLEAAGISEVDPDNKDPRGSTKKPRDLTRAINLNDIKIRKKYEESVTDLLNDGYAKRRKAAADQVQDENAKLREMYRLNEEYVKNVDGKYKELTEEQRKQIEEQNKLIEKTIINNLKALQLQLQQINKEQEAASIRTRRNVINPAEISSAIEAAEEGAPIVTTNAAVTRNASQIEASLVKERELMAENLDLEYALILNTNRQLQEAGDSQARSEEEIIIELNEKKLALWAKYDQKILSARETDIENQLEVVEKGSDEELKLLLEQLEVRRQLALAQNASAPAEQQVSTSAINAQFDQQRNLIEGDFAINRFDLIQAAKKAEFNIVEHTEREITKFTLEQERKRLQMQINLAKEGKLKWSKEQIEAAEYAVQGIDRKLSELDDFFENVGENGLGRTLLEKLGFNDKKIKYIENAANIIIEQIQAIADAEVEAAEKAVEAAEARVEAAQKAYDAEVEARNNGYAHNVATAKKELQQEKKNQQQKQKQLEEAQRRQEQLNTITQAGSLITASAQLWSAFSSIPIIGPALAIAAIATMWGSFAEAKVKAKQVTATQEYGEGGLEFLEGGSHASGNDIDLGVNNKKNRRMKAEGGEALAIINKKRTAKYRKILPDVIDSLNKGTFEDKYLNAFASSDKLNISINSKNNIDISKIETDVHSIKKQNETKYYMAPNGTTIIQRKNVKRIIKN